MPFADQQIGLVQPKEDPGRYQPQRSRRSPTVRRPGVEAAAPAGKTGRKADETNEPPAAVRGSPSSRWTARDRPPIRAAQRGRGQAATKSFVAALESNMLSKMIVLIEQTDKRL
jgi:hypothetical protein